MKEALLYLCHRMPFPPNKGDKITTFNMLKFLSKHYDVYLGTFIDCVEDKQYCDKVRQYCKESCFIEINPNLAKLKSISAFVKGEPITVNFYRNKALQQWVNEILIQKNINKTFIYSACMAQYVLNATVENLYKIIQFADIDSDKWRQFANTQNLVMEKVYLREHRTLFAYEKHITENFDLSCFISDAEVELYKSMIAPELHRKIKTLSNGIDSDFFSPKQQSLLQEETSITSDNYIVFTGAMNYLPNEETVIWFVEHIWTKIIEQIPSAKFYIVGTSPSKKVIKLNKNKGVVVTGEVADVRPYLAYAKAAIAPMQIARGIQNKILEAMAMELPVLTNTLGAEGFEDLQSDDLFITDSIDAMQQWICEKLILPAYKAKGSRQWLQENYSWNAKLTPLLDYWGA